LSVETGTIQEVTSNSISIIGKRIYLNDIITAYGHIISEDSTFTEISDKSTFLWPLTTGTFTSDFTDLNTGTLYFLKAYAESDGENIYGEKIQCMTYSLPVVFTSKVTSASADGATCGGNVILDSGFPITEKGVCWSKSEEPTIANDKTIDGIGLGEYVSEISGLLPNTTYYIRAYATNSKGTAYGDQIALITAFIDSRDENAYRQVKIGSQIWMAENLAYLPEVSPPTEGSLTEPFYYVYDYEGTSVSEAKATDNYSIYGVLYNGPAANPDKEYSNLNPSGVQGVCPSGWHLPGNAEWRQLIEFFGGDTSLYTYNFDIIGGKLKEEGFAHWLSPNLGATDNVGFTALPAGYRTHHPEFYFRHVGIRTGFWTSGYDEVHNVVSHTVHLYNNLTRITLGGGETDNGFSIRCVKD
jgi:uncharacterized protein (TIGR02145 family)